MILIAGPGQGLQIPQALYPTQLFNAPPDVYDNVITLNGGDALPIPAGRWLVSVGQYSVLEVLDPVTNAWRFDPQAATRGNLAVVLSDGFSRRIANLTGCVVSGIVAGGGSGFAQSTATITASAGGSTWQAVVGGSLSITSVTAAGSGYTEAPLVFIPAPPAGLGVQATAYATISAGTVASVSLTNFGAGYTTAPTLTLLPNPYDTATGIVTATATCALTNAGKITAAICTNNGAPLATLTNLTLTAAGGAGTGATITPVVMQTVTANSLVAAGVGFGSATAPAGISSAQAAATSVAAIKNPMLDFSTGWVDRPFSGTGIANAAGCITSINTYDGGLFLVAPTAVVIPGAGGLALSSTAVAPSITFTMGSTQDQVWLQPL